MSAVSRPPGQPPPPRPVDPALVLSMLALTALFGLNAPSMRVLVGGMAPIMGAALRGVVALALLTAWGLARGERLRYWNREGMHGLIVGLIFAVEFVFIYTGAKYTNGGHLSVCVNSAPFFVAVGAHYLLPGDRLHTARVVGLVCAFCGVGALFYDQLFVTQLGYWRGDLLALIGAALWAVTTLYIKRTIAHRMSGVQLLHVQLLSSTPVLFAASLLLEPEPFFAMTPLIWAQVLFQGGVVVFVGYLTWATLLRTYPASAMHAFTFLAPVWGVTWGVLLLGEVLTPLMGVGIAAVGLGLWLVNRPRRTA